jgi:hypothetical protein
MGASADQIEREIRETRERMDENLALLEDQAVSNAVRFGRIAAVALVVAGAGLAGFLIYRRVRRPALKERLEGVSPEGLRDLAVEIGTRMKEKFPSITVTLNDKREPEPGLARSVLSKLAPSLIGTASTAVIEKLSRRSGARLETSRAAYD